MRLAVLHINSTSDMECIARVDAAHLIASRNTASLALVRDTIKKYYKTAQLFLNLGSEPPPPPLRDPPSIEARDKHIAGSYTFAKNASPACMPDVCQTESSTKRASENSVAQATMHLLLPYPCSDCNVATMDD